MTEDKASDDITEESQVEETEAPVDEYALGSEVVSEGDDEEDEPLVPIVFRRAFNWYLKHKKQTLPATVAILIIGLLIIPVSRYAILGIVAKKHVQVRVTDAETDVPISGVQVEVRGKRAETNAEGKVVLNGIKVGTTTFHAKKTYYETAQSKRLVGLRSSVYEIKLKANGRQVPIHVINKITGKGIAGARVVTADTEVTTNQNGEAIIVLSSKQSKAAAKVTAKGFNTHDVQIDSSGSSRVQNNTFTLTPEGSVYFLSKLSGKIDVVKTNLDGSDRKVVLAGTGEEGEDSELFASRDWRYLVLFAKRSSAGKALYLIDTNSGALTEIDSGKAQFDVYGWLDSTFVYTVARNEIKDWQPKKLVLKTYNAAIKQLTTVDETNAEGSDVNDYAAEWISNITVLKDRILYTKNWRASYYSVYRLAGKRMYVYSVKPGSSKQPVKDFDAGNNGYIITRFMKPNHAYVGVYNADTAYYEYKEGKLQQSKITDNDLYKSYPDVRYSQNGQRTAWSESRDGKYSLFVGAADAANPREILNLSEYAVYGWFADDYVLLTKNGSEMFIMPAEGLSGRAQVIKISDYHKSSFRY